MILFKAKAFEQRKMFDSSLYYFNLAIDKKENVSVLLDRANLYYRMADYNKAAVDYSKADLIEPNSGAYGLARCYAHIGNKEKAIEFLEKHLSSKFKLPQAEVKLDKAFISLSNSPEWKQLWDKEWYNRNDDQIQEATFLLKNKEYLELIDYVNNQLKPGSHKHELIALRGRAYFESGSYNMAINEFTEAIDVFHKNESYYFYRAESYDKTEEYQSAADDYTSALKIDPYKFEVYPLRAEAFRRIKKYQEALADIEFYMQFFPDDDNALFEAGLIALDSKNYIKALGYFNQKLAHDSKCALCFEKRGNAYEDLKMLVYAEKDYTSALLIQPDNRDVLFRRGVVRYGSNNKSGACADWKKAAKMNHFMASEYIQRYCK